jgi:hypothetical protein
VFLLLHLSLLSRSLLDLLALGLQLVHLPFKVAFLVLQAGNLENKKDDIKMWAFVYSYYPYRAALGVVKEHTSKDGAV